MARDSSDSTPIASRDALVGYMASGCKAPDQWRIGTEHEKVPFYVKDKRPVPYEGPRGVRALLDGMQGLLGWRPIIEDDHPIGLEDVTGGGAISLEPGGQFELSGAPLETLHQMCCETHAHMAQVREIAEPLGIGFLTLGMSPQWTRAETPIMPKRRYEIMRRYMPKVGGHGLDMMFRTATVQVNLDFASEADMVEKLRIGLALQPLATALFANSPLTEGRPNGFKSMRSQIWLDTDGDRTGMLAFAFEDGMGFERYVDWALDVPMYFVKRGDVYHDVAGASFRDLMAGRLDALPGERATLSDWANHLSTLFPEVRLKRYIEMRGADTGATPYLCALPAFWVGLLYDKTARDGAWQIVKTWTAEERQALRNAAPRLALDAEIAGRPLRAVAREVLALAHEGLARRAKRDAKGRDEEHFLAPLDEVVETGLVPADRILARYETEWKGRLEPLFDEFVY
jgi:glutamate--cysteine ligase